MNKNVRANYRIRCPWSSRKFKVRGNRKHSGLRAMPHSPNQNTSLCCDVPLAVAGGLGEGVSTVS